MKFKTYGYVTVSDIPDNSIASVDVMYYLSNSSTECVGGSWSTDPPPWKDGKYYWQKTVTVFTDSSKPPSETTPVCITGGKGNTGVGIQSITNYYLASEKSSDINILTPGWTPTFQPITPTKKYLWNYEVITYTDKSEYGSDPCIIGVYGDAGSTGKGILKIDNYYLTTSQGSGVTTSTKGWSATPSPTSETNTFLWNYEIITYTDESTYSTTPHIIGTHGSIGPKGDKGESGTGIESISEEYYLSTSKTTQEGGSWTTSPPTWSAGKYIWTRTKIVYKNPTSTVYTTPICDASWEAVNNIEVGGKNLLLGTSSIIEYNYKVCNWTMDSQDIVITSEIDEATDSLHIVTNGEGTEYNGLASVISGIDFKRGETYTFSCAIRGSFDASKQFGAQIYYFNSNGENLYDYNSRTSWIDNGDGINDGINTANFQRRYFTFVVPYDYDEAANYLVINIFCNVMDIYVRNFQLERGNKPTDWRMADEDMKSQIDSAISTVSGVTSKVDQITQSITNRVWLTDINEYINNYDQSTVQVISEKQNQYQQTLDSLSLNISNIQTSLTTKADGTVVSELESRINTAVNDINGFKQTVSETYATQGDLNNIKADYVLKTEYQQLSNKFSWLVSSNSSSTSLVLTDKMVEAMTKQFVIKSPDGKRVVIENGIVKTDFLQSHNYVAGSGSPAYSSSGSFFNMTDGAFYSKNFVVDTNGNAYIKGTVNATAGKIGDCTIANGKLTVPAANITGKLEADHIIVGSGSLDDDLKDLVNGIYARFDGGGNSLGYCHLAQIKITGNYVNDAIVIGINQRGNGYSQCCITFANAGNADPALGKFLKIGTAEWRIAKSSTSTWNLYVKKSEAYDSITVIEYQNVRDGKKLTWVCENSEVPAGAIYATQCASFYEIDSTAGGTSGSNKLITSGAANSINNKADKAQNTANSANTAASNANKAAQNAQSSADKAQSAADKAHSTANTANQNANAAKDTASAAEAKAAEAKRYADTALTQSEAAQAYAESVKGIADTAKISAEAAEDLAQAAQDVANLVNNKIGTWCAEADKTYIDGGKIYTGTIVSKSIAANAITSEKIQAGAITVGKITTNNLQGTNGYINLHKGTFAYWNSNKTAGISWDGSKLNLIGSGTFSGTVTCSYLDATVSGRIANWYFNDQCIYNSYNKKENSEGAWAGQGMYFGEKGLSIGSPTKSSSFRVTVDGDFTGTYATITGVLDAKVVQSTTGYKVGMETGYSGYHVVSYQSNNDRVLIGRLSSRDGDALYTKGYFAFPSDGTIRPNGNIILSSGNSIQGNISATSVSATSVSASESISSQGSLASGGNIFTNGTLFLQIGSNVPTVSNGKILMRSSSGGAVGVQASSSKRYKQYINLLAKQDALNLLDLDVVAFKYNNGYLMKGDAWEDKIIPGFFAEDVEKIDPILCIYNDNIVEDWNYRTMIPYMLKIDQIQHEDIALLKQENDSLKQRLSKIESLLAKLNITEEI